MACDVSWKSKLSTTNDENVLLKTQVDFVVQERENIKHEYQKLFNSIKATQTQHQKELDELIEHVNQKTYAYAVVRAQNQDLLMTITELKNKLKTIDNRKNVNTKFDKSENSGTLLYVTPLPKNIAVKAKQVSNTKVNTDRSKLVTSHPTSKNEQSVESSNSVRRPKSKDTKLKNRVLKNTNDKRSSAHVQKMSHSVSIDFNKCETMHSNVCQSNVSVLYTKTVNAVNDGSNIVCVSYGKDLFLLSHEKCVARYALSRNSSVKRALFTTLIATKYKNLGATSVVTNSRLSVAKTPTATNKVIQLVLWIVDSGCSKHMTGNLQLLRNFIEKFMGTVCFGNDHFAAVTGYGDYVQGNLTICHVYYVEGLGHKLFLGRQFCDGDLEAKAIATACFTQNCSIVHTRKMKPKADIGIFIEYYATSSPEVLDYSVTHTLDNKTTSSSSSIIVEEDEAPQIVSSSVEQVANELNFPVLNKNDDELVQEDVAEFDGNAFYNPPQIHMFVV
ncbi:hypothetical protein Tco_0005964 [Tanacetum coccineum]